MWGVQELSISYGGRNAVSNVSFELRPGHITVLVGGDGAGKTSILKALVGVLQPSAGRVMAPSKDRIGYVSAGPGVYHDLSVEENLRFSGRAYGVGATRMNERIEQLLEVAGLEPARNRLAGKLSGGMRQKLALATAVLHDPELLVLDEPTTGVDPVSRADLWALIARSAASGTAVVSATSYIDEAERAEEVVVLVDGEVMASGSPEQIVASVSGRTFQAQEPPSVWRRGKAWRVWSPSDTELTAADGQFDLEDAVVVAELDRQRGARGGAGR